MGPSFRWGDTGDRRDGLRPIPRIFLVIFGLVGFKRRIGATRAVALQDHGHGIPPSCLLHASMRERAGDA